MHKLLNILIWTTLFSCFCCQMITIFDYNQEESLTRCTSGLLSGVDEVVFKAQIDYAQDKLMKFVIFQTKKKHLDYFNFLTDCNVQEDCNSSSNTYGKRLDTYKIEITIRVKAASEFSGAKIRGKLITSKNQEIVSGETIFPHISELEMTSGELIVNGITINDTTSECQLVISSQQLNITLICESKVLPCIIEISTEESNETVRREGHAIFNKEFLGQQEAQLQIKYGVCGADIYFKIVTCNLTRGDNTTNQLILMSRNQHTNSYIIATIVLSLILSISIVANTWFIYILKYKYKQENRIKYKEDNDIRQQDSLVHFKGGRKTKRQNCKAFINIENQFNSSIPERDHEKDLRKLKHNIDTLTVIIHLTCVSSLRPDCYPYTDKEYPFYNKRGYSDIMRCGTGIIKFVSKYNDNNKHKCPCNKCQHSSTPGNIRGKVHIFTAKSLVFDDTEAKKSKFTIKVSGRNKTYEFVGLHVTESDINHDTCVVEFVTCNKVALDYLEMIFKKTLNNGLIL